MHRLVDERDKESSRLAGAGVGHADHVALLKDERNRPILDRRRVREAALHDILLEFRIYPKI